MSEPLGALHHHSPQLGPDEGVGFCAVAAILLRLFPGLMQARLIEISIRGRLLQQEPGVGPANSERGFDARRIKNLTEPPFVIGAGV